MKKYTIDLPNNRWEGIIEILPEWKQEEFWKCLNNAIDNTELIRKISQKRFCLPNRKIVLDINEVSKIPEDLYKEVSEMAVNILQEYFITPILEMRIKEKPGLPLNNVFVTLQKIGNYNITIGKKKNKTVLNYTGYVPKNAFEQALYLSILYSLIYYATKRFTEIRLSDLMNNIGYPRRGNSYTETQKLEILEMLRKIGNTKVSIDCENGNTSYFIKDIFPNYSNENYSTKILDIRILKLYKSLEDKILKEAIIYFTPYFKTDEINFDNTSNVLSFSLSESEYKNFAIFLTYGHRLNGKQITITPRELLDFLKIKPDKKNPRRTYELINKIFNNALRDKLIKNIDMKSLTEFTGNWFYYWLSTEITIQLS